jgi:putative PEP-CTERM system histidine kinase
MNSVLNFNSLLAANLVLLGCLLIYLATKITQYPSVGYIVASLIPLVSIQLGSYMFSIWPSSSEGAKLIVLAAALIPVTIVPVSHRIGRTSPGKREISWIIYYLAQSFLLIFVIHGIFTGRIVEWVTGILEEPIVIIDGHWRYYFFNVVGSSILALLCFDKTLKQANKPQQNELKFVFIAFLGFAVYFSYLAINILLSSYISLPMLQLGAAIIFLGSLLLGYGFAKYPLWEVKIRVSRHVVFGTLTVSATLAYLIISGSILDVLRVIQPARMNSLLPIVAFALIALFLFVNLSPNFRSRVKLFVTRNFFHTKYEYRDLWMKFSEKSSTSLNIRDLLPPIAELVADSMFVSQITFWLRSSASDSYFLAYSHGAADSKISPATPLRLKLPRDRTQSTTIFRVPGIDGETIEESFPLREGLQVLHDLGIERLVLVEKGGEILALIGIGAQPDKEASRAEDEQFVSSVSNQLSHLILTHQLSEELLLAREWDSFNRFASFILHDLKNLATLQSMTLDNAKHLRDNPSFMSDALTTFGQTTEKMINLIASLSVQRGQFSLRQQPVNILEVIAQTFDDLKIDRRNGVSVRTAFPPKNDLPAISGDPELLQKAFTNLLLNAIQSLPKGEGAVDVTVSREPQGKITMSIRDTGCGIAPERLANLFRPFQTTKERGLGVGLCHTRSIIEVHGGQIRIESQVNAGTRVDVELPTI